MQPPNRDENKNYIIREESTVSVSTTTAIAITMFTGQKQLLGHIDCVRENEHLVPGTEGLHNKADFGGLPGKENDLETLLYTFNYFPKYFWWTPVAQRTRN